jgi:hypothetical protein
MRWLQPTMSDPLSHCHVWDNVASSPSNWIALICMTPGMLINRSNRCRKFCPVRVYPTLTLTRRDLWSLPSRTLRFGGVGAPAGSRLAGSLTQLP